MKTRNASISALVIYLIIICGLAAGWVMNVISIAHSSFSEITGVLVLRVIGVFIPPLGAVMGLFV